jgi:hypothetical protein
MRTVWLKIGTVFVSTPLLFACSTVTPVEPQLVRERLPFIQDGKTSKEEILNRLGEPANRYEDGRILTYKMCKDIELQGRLHVCGTRGGREGIFSGGTLILVFGADNLVERHSMVVK